jgi:hypothetical protein
LHFKHLTIKSYKLIKTSKNTYQKHVRATSAGEFIEVLKSPDSIVLADSKERIVTIMFTENSLNKQSIIDFILDDSAKEVFKD